MLLGKGGIGRLPLPAINQPDDQGDNSSNEKEPERDAQSPNKTNRKPSKTKDRCGHYNHKKENR